MGSNGVTSFEAMDLIRRGAELGHGADYWR